MPENDKKQGYAADEINCRFVIKSISFYHFSIVQFTV